MIKTKRMYSKSKKMKPKTRKKGSKPVKNKDLSFLPIALSKKEIKEFDLEPRIDFLEYYHVCYNPHFLYPIDTTKMFTIKFKDNVEIDAFEMIYDKILDEFPDVQLYQLQIRDIDFQDIEQSTYTKTLFNTRYLWHKLAEYINGTYINYTDDRLDDKDTTKIFFIENRESVNFGHYGVIFYDNNTKIYSYFDSMVEYNGINVSSEYTLKFTDVFKYYFVTNISIPIEEMNEYIDCKYSSLEIIGGEIRLENTYTEQLLTIDNIQNDTFIDFYTNQTIMGFSTVLRKI